MYRSKQIHAAFAIVCLLHFGLVGWAAGQIGKSFKYATKKVVRPVVSAIITKQAIQTLPKLIH